MIKAITITLSNGESLTMTLATPDTSLGFAIVDCDGITPGSATLNGSEWVTVAGGSYESSHIPKRTINLALRFLPTALSESVADIRRKTYKWFPLTKKIRLTFHHESFFGKKKSYYIEGYVERNEADIFSEEEGCNISIVCFDPYFKDTIDETGNFNQVIPLFYFEFPGKHHTTPPPAEGEEEPELGPDRHHPFPISERKKYDRKEVLNNSTINTGGIFTIEAIGPVANPIIFSATTSQRIALEYTMHEGETIIVDTRDGYKNIYKNDAHQTNMIKYLQPNSDFITFVPGTNIIGIFCDDPDTNLFNMNVSYVVTPLHMGV